MKTTIYRVYRHICPDGMTYIGMSTNPRNRWYPYHYLKSALYPFIVKWGWENIRHEIIYTCEDKNEALEIENDMILYFKENGCCINHNRSGSISIKNKHEYQREYRYNNAERIRELKRVSYRRKKKRIGTIQIDGQMPLF